MNGVLLGVLGYILVQFAIGAWVSRRIATESDYINAGRRIGPVLGAFTVFATWFGAEAVVGTAGQVYEKGLAGAGADPFGYALALVVAGAFFAATLWRRGLVTFADFFRQRFGPRVEMLVVLALLPGSVFWAAAQIRAFGQVVSSVSDINVPVAITVATLVVVAYTVLGGLMADAVTDLVQGIAIILGLVVLAVLAASSSGGFGASLAAVSSDRLVLADAPLLEMVERFAVPVCGTIVAVELVSRMLGCRSAEVARMATISGGLLYLAVGLIPVYLGLLGPTLVPGLAGDMAEQVVPEIARLLLPGLAFVLFAGALISAILSTVELGAARIGGAAFAQCASTPCARRQRSPEGAYRTCVRRRAGARCFGFGGHCRLDPPTRRGRFGGRQHRHSGVAAVRALVGIWRSGQRGDGDRRRGSRMGGGTCHRVHRDTLSGVGGGGRCRLCRCCSRRARCVTIRRYSVKVLTVMLQRKQSFRSYP